MQEVAAAGGVSVHESHNSYAGAHGPSSTLGPLQPTGTKRTRTSHEEGMRAALTAAWSGADGCMRAVLRLACGRYRTLRENGIDGCVRAVVWPTMADASLHE